MSRNAFASGRGSWDGTMVMAIDVAQMEEGEQWMAIIGRGGSFNELALHDAFTGERQWVRSLADKATAVAAIDLEGDGTKEILVGSMSAWLCALDIDGTLRWSAMLPNGVLALSGAGDGLLAQCSDGKIYRLSTAGEITGVHAPEPAGAPSHRNHWAFRHGEGTALVGDDTGALTALAVGEK